MLKFMWSFIICFSFILFSNVAMAGLLVEPILGLSYPNSVDTDNKSYSSGAGFGLGGRLGYQRRGIQIGADLMLNGYYMDSDDFDESLRTTEYGAFLGYEFPALLRIYGTYIFAADGTTEIRNKDFDLTGGKGAKFGIGFTILPLIDLNIDYRKVDFANDDLDYDAFMFSASMPFNFFGD